MRLSEKNWKGEASALYNALQTHRHNSGGRNQMKKIGRREREREREKDSECLLGRRKGDKETPSDITGQRSSRVGLKVLRSDRLVFWPPSSSSLLLTLLSSNRGIRSGLTPRLQPVIRTNLWLKLFFFFFYLFCWRRQCVASIYSPPCPTIPLHH